MISFLIIGLVQTTSIWPLNKANPPPDTWCFYQCVHVARIKKIRLSQFYMWQVHILREANFGPFSHADIINSIKALIQQPQPWRPNDPIQQRLRYELDRGEESPEASGTSQAWNTAHKYSLAGEGHTCGLRTLISKWQGCERLLHAALPTAPDLTAAHGNRRDEEQDSTARSNNRQPWTQGRTTRSRKLKKTNAKILSSALRWKKKTPPNFIISSAHA